MQLRKLQTLEKELSKLYWSVALPPWFAKDRSDDTKSPTFRHSIFDPHLVQQLEHRISRTGQCNLGTSDLFWGAMTDYPLSTPLNLMHPVFFMSHLSLRVKIRYWIATQSIPTGLLILKSKSPDVDCGCSHVLPVIDSQRPYIGLHQNTMTIHFVE